MPSGAGGGAPPSGTGATGEAGRRRRRRRRGRRGGGEPGTGQGASGSPGAFGAQVGAQGAQGAEGAEGLRATTSRNRMASRAADDQTRPMGTPAATPLPRTSRPATISSEGRGRRPTLRRRHSTAAAELHARYHRRAPGLATCRWRCSPRAPGTTSPGAMSGPRGLETVNGIPCGGFPGVARAQPGGIRAVVGRRVPPGPLVS